MLTQANWYEIENVDELDTPALAIYHEEVIQNIEAIKNMVPQPDLLRPHVKTHKLAQVTRLMMQHGINKFKCATITEAEMLGICRAEDALLAYQPTLPKLKRLIALIEKYPETRFSCLVDNYVSASMISAYSLEQRLKIPVYIDLNVGMNRTGIKPDSAYELFIQLLDLPGVQFMGLHAYDGHIRDTGIEERTAHCNRDFAAVEDLRNAIEQQGYPYPLLIAGGSPTFAIHAARKNAECSPGTFVFWDKGYHDNIPEQSFDFAALIISRVVSFPDENKICIDLGYKAISSENDLLNRVYFLNAPKLKPYSQSEEHMVIEAGAGHGYKIGDVMYALPIHICPSIAMYDRAVVVSNRTIIETWSITSRGRNSILQ